MTHHTRGQFTSVTFVFDVKSRAKNNLSKFVPHFRFFTFSDLTENTMPSKLKEKIANHAKKFKPKLVLSKLRQEGPAGARRLVWLLVAFILYYRGW